MEFSGNLEGLVADLSWKLSLGNWAEGQSDNVLARLRSLETALPRLGRHVLGSVAGTADRVRLQGEQISRSIEFSRVIKLDDKLSTFNLLISLNLGTDITRVYAVLNALLDGVGELLLVAMMADEELEELRAHRAEHPDDECEAHIGFLVGLLDQEAVEHMRHAARHHPGAEGSHN